MLILAVMCLFSSVLVLPLEAITPHGSNDILMIFGDDLCLPTFDD